MNKFNRNDFYALLTLFVASILWYIMFVIKPLNFWLEMSISVIVLTLSAFLIKEDISIKSKSIERHILIGIGSAVILYFIFYIGNIISGYIFPFKDAQIASVYSSKSESSLYLIGFLLLFIIGPCEEIYWRGFIQEHLSIKFGENKGYIISSLLYALVHVITGNFMLIIAALVCGLYWGWIYKKEKSLVPVIISHALWDLSIFVLFPVM